MEEKKSNYKIWVRIGICAGLAVSVIYPMMIFAPLPKKVVVVLASLFGPLLMLASLGLYYFLKAQRNTVTGQLAVLSNIIASVLVSMMLIVQLSVNLSMNGLMDSAGEEISDAPGDAGLIDLGPFVGLWYLAATVLVIRSLKWFDRQLS